MWQWFRCLFGKHVVDREKSIIMELGAVFHADICKACLKPWIGEFLCNAWDESQTEVRDGVTHLQGMNPILRVGSPTGAFELIGDEEQLHQISKILQERRRKGLPLPPEFGGKQ